MKTKTTIKNAIPLWQSSNGLWQIEKIGDSELAITNGNDICYAYISKDYRRLVVDRVIYPKYIESKAIRLAKKNIKSIYA